MKGQKGFTLIELLIVMMVLGIVTSFVIPTVLNSVDNARATTCLIYRQNIQVATDIYIRRYALVNHDNLPALSVLITEGLLVFVDECPSGGVYTWNNHHYHGPVKPYYLYCSIHFTKDDDPNS